MLRSGPVSTIAVLLLSVVLLAWLVSGSVWLLLAAVVLLVMALGQLIRRTRRRGVQRRWGRASGSNRADHEELFAEEEERTLHVMEDDARREN